MCKNRKQYKEARFIFSRRQMRNSKFKPCPIKATKNCDIPSPTAIRTPAIKLCDYVDDTSEKYPTELYKNSYIVKH